MKKKIIGLFCFTFIINFIISQNVNLISLPQKNKVSTATNIYLIGIIDESIYFHVESTNNKKTRLLKFNKENTKLNNYVDVRGFKIKNTNPLIKNAEVGAIFITKDKTIRFFWFSDETNNVKIFTSEFDQNLREIKKPQLVYQLQNKAKAFSRAKLFALKSEDGKKYIVGGEESSLKEENVSIQYKILNSELEVENSYTADLPYSVSERDKSIKTTSDYRITNKGDLFYNTSVNLNDSKDKKSKSERGYLLGRVKSTNGDNTYKIIAFDNKNVFNLDYELLSDRILAFGTYYSYGDKSDYRKYGVFTVNLDLETLNAIDDVNFNMLDEDKLAFTNFYMSQNEKKKFTPEKFAINKIRTNGLIIEDYKKLPNDEVIIVLSSSHIIITRSQNSTSVTTYHVATTYVKLNKMGKVDWFSCTQIDQAYGGYKDIILPTIYNDNKIFLIDQGFKLGTTKKLKNDLNTVYVVDVKTGDIVVKSVAQIGGNEYRFVADNEIYVINNKQTFKPEVCIGAILCFPTLVFTSNLRNSVITFGKYNID